MNFPVNFISPRTEQTNERTKDTRDDLTFIVHRRRPPHRPPLLVQPCALQVVAANARTIGLAPHRKCLLDAGRLQRADLRLLAVPEQQLRKADAILAGTETIRFRVRPG